LFPANSAYSGSRGRVCKSCKFCEAAKGTVFPQKSCLQKYRAKGRLNARIFAKAKKRSATTVKIGYARVSTRDQNLDLQLKALKKAGCEKIFREKLSGFTRQRPEFQRMVDQIPPGDTIIVWKLDRLARSTRDLLNTVETINEAAGKFQSLSEPWANTTTHAGKMIMTVFAGHRRVRTGFDPRANRGWPRSSQTARCALRPAAQAQYRSGASCSPIACGRQGGPGHR
jgi:hypothetical protein